ncbi:hypothetical protein, partial [Salmonella sp. s51228]|uniref:hypothetical protein n=1 Tax=Salmonella sp. s51228 TaxID=3159652 RepID=UPI00398179B6
MTCPICLGILYQPIKTECNHLFCLTCIKTAIEQNPPFGYYINPNMSKGKCPIDRSPINVNFAIDQEMYIKIQNLVVNCIMSEHGCVWSGKLHLAAEHIK